MKALRLGIEVVVKGNFQKSTTTCALPADLLTVEQVLLGLARAVKARASRSGLQDLPGQVRRVH